MNSDEKKMIEQAEKALEEMQRNSQKTGVRAFIETNAGIFQRGDIFEAATVKGGKNYIVFMFVSANGWAYYCHGDKAKKVRIDQFQKLIDYGDLVPVPPEKRDPERMSLSVLGLMAMDHGLSFNDYMNVVWGTGKGSEAHGTTGM